MPVRPEVLREFGDSLLLIVAVLIAAYISYKYGQRRRFLKTLAIDRITPDELKSIMDLNERVVVLDLRNQLDVDMDRFRIPGAFHSLPEILSRQADTCTLLDKELASNKKSLEAMQREYEARMAQQGKRQRSQQQSVGDSHNAEKHAVSDGRGQAPPGTR